jgi:hypothetical protein
MYFASSKRKGFTSKSSPGGVNESLIFWIECMKSICISKQINLSLEHNRTQSHPVDREYVSGHPSSHKLVRSHIDNPSGRNVESRDSSSPDVPGYCCDLFSLRDKPQSPYPCPCIPKHEGLPSSSLPSFPSHHLKRQTGIYRRVHVFPATMS